ncbi:MAG: PKD domain-containing protein, partial [Candidatus Aenigmatarchaeota archaeon]
MPLKVQFTDLTQNSPNSWNWDFGDGETSSEQNPTHTYLSPGTYTVTLTASNSEGSDTETKTDYITVLEPLPGCVEGPAFELLRRLNSFPYDFYEDYYDYDDNAAGHDPQKTCPGYIETDDIWMTRFFPDSLAFYPSTATLIDSELGIDLNTWYDNGTVVQTYVTGTDEPVLEQVYPEYEINLTQRIEDLPFIGDDPELVGMLSQVVEANEFALRLDGIYSQGPIDEVNDSYAQISTLFGGHAYTPGIGQDIDCKGSFLKYYDMDTETFGNTLPDQFGCSSSLGLKDTILGFSKDLFIDLILLTFDATVDAKLNISPTADAGVNLRIAGPQAMVPGVTSRFVFDVDASATGEICTPDGCDGFGVSLPVPELSEVGLLGEAAASIGDFEPHQSVRSLFPRISDGKDLDYRGLKAFSPVFRIESSKIVLEANISVDLSDFKIPCGGIIDCRQDIFEGEVFSIDPMELYIGQTKIIVHSPVEVHVYDSLGRHVGPNNSGGFDTEIFESAYYEDGHVKMATFPTDTDNFVLVLKGTASGTYNLTLERPVVLKNGTENIIVQQGVYEISEAPTDTGRADVYILNFGAIQKNAQERLDLGAEPEDAVKKALQYTVVPLFEETREPAMISAPYVSGEAGETVTLNAALHSPSGPLGGKTVMFGLEGETLGTAVTGSDGAAALDFKIPAGFDDGRHEVSAAFAGDGGYTPADTLFDLYVKNLPPRVSIDTPAYAEGTVEINVLVEDSNLLSQIILIDGEEVSDEESFSWDTTGHGDGVHRIDAVAYDTKGLKGSAVAFVLSDNTPTEIRFLNVEDGGFYQSFAPEVKIKDAWLKSHSLRLDGRDYEAGTVIETEGPHTLEVEAKDWLGHTTRESVSFYIDNTPPEITLNGVADKETYRYAVTFSYGVSDNLDPNPYSEASVNNPEVFESEGTYTVWVKAADAAGNAAERTATFKIDFHCAKDSDCGAGQFCNKKH